MRQLLTDYDVTGTSTTGTIVIPKRRTSAIWLWKFTMPAGTGTNELKVEAKTVANVEADAATEELFELTEARQWQGPAFINDAMVTAAPSSILRFGYSFRTQWDVLRFTFTRSGAGSRTFRVNLWSSVE